MEFDNEDNLQSYLRAHYQRSLLTEWMLTLLLEEKECYFTWNFLFFWLRISGVRISSQLKLVNWKVYTSGETCKYLLYFEESRYSSSSYACEKYQTTIRVIVINRTQVKYSRILRRKRMFDRNAISL